MPNVADRGAVSLVVIVQVCGSSRGFAYVFNAFVTFLSVYYMTGVKRSLEIFRCIKKNPELVDARHCKNRPDDADPLMLIYTKQILKASDGAGEVVCGQYNYTTCVFDFDQVQGPPTQGLFRLTINKIVGQTYAPGYNRLSQMAMFFTLLYGLNHSSRLPCSPQKASGSSTDCLYMARYLSLSAKARLAHSCGTGNRF